MKIVSRFPYLWPHLNFSLVVGENVIDESDIPLAAHGKLEHLSRSPGKTTPTRDEEEKLVMVDTPAPISGYEPSAAFVAAAEKLNPKRAAGRLPKVATMKTIAAPAAPAPTADKPQAQADQGKGERHR